MNADEAKSALKLEIEPLVANVFLADQAYYLLKTSGDFADDLNVANFGNLFGFLQSILSDTFILSVTKIFEKENTRYPTHSIPVVISLLEKNSDFLNIIEKYNFLRVLNDTGLRGSIPEGLQDSELTRRVAGYFRGSLPDISKKENCGLSLALDAAKSIRNKRIAHDEKVMANSLLPVTWKELNKLLAYARSFIGAIGWGYLSIAYEANKEYILSRDAMHTSAAMRRLLKNAGIRENESVGERERNHFL
ncbi:MAG: hypothetical protein DDT30_01548 [Dehalococcoidia bacterium]|nr:hypothetical protein [Bacillota bacterium]